MKGLSQRLRTLPHWRRLGGAGLLLVAAGMLANSERVFTDAILVSLLPVVGCGLWLLFSADAPRAAAPLREKKDARRTVMSAVLASLFLVMLSVFEIHDSRIFSYTHLLTVVYPGNAPLARFYQLFHCFAYLPAVGLSAWYLLDRLLAACEIGKPGLAAPLDANVRRALVRRCTLLIAMATVCGVMCVYPIYNVSDTLLIKQFIDNGEWNAWHTTGYLLFAWLTSLGGKNYFLVVIAQGCCWVYVNWTALRFLSGQVRARRACTVYTAASLASFLPYLYCSIMYKDTLFMACMLGLCVSLVELLTTEPPHISAYVRLAAFGLCVSLFRHGTFPIVLLVLAALLVHAVRRNRALPVRLAVSAVAVCCAYVFFNHILPDRILFAKKSPDYVMYTVPVGMIGAIAESGVPITEEERAVMEEILPYETWAEAYNPYFMDPLSRTNEVVGENIEKIDTLHLGPKLLLLNARFLVRYPRVYLRAFFNANSILWEWTRPDDARAAEWNWMLNYAVSAPETQTRTFGFTDIMVKLARLSYASVLWRSLVWRGGFSLFVLLICAVVFARARRARLLIALLPPLTYTASLMLSIPSQDPRYILPSLAAATFFGTLVFAAGGGAQGGGERKEPTAR